MMIKTIQQLMNEYAERNEGTASAPAVGRRKPNLKPPLLYMGKIAARQKVNTTFKTKPFTEHKMLTLSSLKPGYIDTNELNTVKLIKNFRGKESTFTKTDDIVIGLTQPFTAVVITDETKDIFVSNLFAIIRMDDVLKQELDPYYLCAYLNSEIINNQLVRLSRQKTGNLITSNLITLPVLIPDKKEQEHIATCFKFKINAIKNIQTLTYDIDCHIADSINNNYQKTINDNE